MGGITRGRRSPAAQRFVNKFRAGLVCGCTLLVLAIGGAQSAAPWLLHGEEAGEPSSAADRRQLARAEHFGDDADAAASWWSSSNRRRLASSCPDLTSFDDNGGVAVYILAIIYVFVGIAIICDDYFVESLEEICNALKIPADVAGATFMAAGSSAPELATVVIATLIQPGDEGLGDVVGAAVFNSMTIVGASAIFAGQVLEITPFPFVRDISFYLLSILLLAIFIANDEKIEVWESVLLLLGYAGYITFMFYNVRIARWFQKKATDEKSSKLMRSMSRRLSQGYLDLPKPELDADGNEIAQEASTTGGFSRDKSKKNLNADLANMQKEINGDAVAKSLEGSLKGAGEHKNGTATPPPSPPPSPPVIVSAASVELNPQDESEAVEISVKVKSSGGSVKLKGTPSSVAAAQAVLEAKPDPHKGFADKMGMKEEDSPYAGRPAMGISPVSRTNTSLDSEPPSIATTLADLNIDMPDEEDEPPTLFGRVWAVLRFPYWCLFTVTMPDCLKAKMKDRWFLWLFAGSIAWIAALTYVMLLLTTRVGCILNIPGVVMGLVFISAGTTVPDFLSSILVAKEGQGDMAICNAIGSNIFNIFMGLGFPWFIYSVANQKAYETDSLKGNSAIVPICILFGYVWVLPVTLLATGWKLYKGVGRFLIGMHVAFLVFMLLTNCINGAPAIKLPQWEDSAGCGEYADGHGSSSFFPPSLPPSAPTG